MPCHRFRNTEATRRLPLHVARPGLLPAVMRLLSLPVLVFGPGLGVPATVLLYGVGTPSAIAHAQRLRRWSAWVGASSAAAPSGASGIPAAQH
jgi:hypothetical protein